MTRRYWLAGSALCLSALAAIPSISTAQETRESGWLAWQGCWRATEAPAGEYLCVVPEGPGVRMVTVAGGAVRAEARVFTDGRARVVRQDACNGTELAHWSADGRRVFLTSDLTCEENLTRKVNGVFVFTGPTEWLSVQSVTVGDQVATRTVRYQAIEPSDVPASIARVFNDPTARRAARLAALAPVTTDDVGEAVGAVDASVVEAWLAAIGRSALLGEIQPVMVTEEPVVQTSALTIVNGSTSYDAPREIVHVVEQPTHVHTTYVNVVRSCWDPFFSGYVFGVGGLHLGYGHTHCGGRYYSWYSPWGYDLYGWRYVSSPVVIVRSGPTFIRRPVIIRNPYPNRRYDSRDRYDGPAVIRRTGSTDTRSPVTRTEVGDPNGRVTRSGYTNGRSTGSATQRSTSPSRSSTTTTRSQPTRSSAPVTRSTGTTSGTTTRAVPRTSPSSSGTTTRSVPRTSPSSSGTSGSSSSGSSSTQSGSESRGKAKPRGTTTQ